VEIEDQEEEAVPTVDSVLAETEPAKAPELAPPDKSVKKTLDLLKHLKGLSESLPAPCLGLFNKSDARVKMEFLIDRLDGKPGLLREAKEIAIASSETKPVQESIPTGLNGLKKTLAYMRSLNENLPDRDLSTALDRQIGSVIKDIGGKIKGPPAVEE